MSTRTPLSRLEKRVAFLERQLAKKNAELRFMRESRNHWHKLAGVLQVRYNRAARKLERLRS
jgi:hypothetical protein